MQQRVLSLAHWQAETADGLMPGPLCYHGQLHAQSGHPGARDDVPDLHSAGI